MNGEQLRAAMDTSGIDAKQLADRVGVDVRTIERWLAGRTPYRRNRAALARALGVTPHDLWPEHEPAPGTQPEPTTSGDVNGGSSDLHATYLGAEDPDLPDRLELMESATQRVGLLGLTLADLITGREVVDLLVARAEAGCQVRILLAAPDSVHLHLVAAEHHPGASISDPPIRIWELERTLGYVQPLLAHPNAKARTMITEHTSTLLIADEQILAALHLYATPPDHEPILHLHSGERFYGYFDAHFDLIWQRASDPIGPDPELYPDPDEHPDRYHPLDPQHSGPRYGPFGPTPRRG